MAKQKLEFLRLLRVEDDNVPSLEQELPIVELEQIREWGDFFRLLESDELPGAEPPDLVGIDFRFNNDHSVPSLEPDPKLSEHPVFSKIRWSNALYHKNCGVAIGATIAGMVESSDYPTAIAPHSGAVDDVRFDATTVMLIGQMLAASKMPLRGIASSESERAGGMNYDPFQLAFECTNTMPKHFVAALPKLMPAYRDQLKARAGLTGRGRQRLFVDPESTGRLLAIFEEAKDETELDERLATYGLTFWDRDGDGRDLDLRSLFMDLLQAKHPDRSWGMLPLATIAPGEGKESPGVVIAFVRDLHSSLSDAYEEAGLLIHHNLRASEADIRKYTELPSGFHRFLALVFAFTEARQQASEPSEMRIEVHSFLGANYEKGSNTLRRIIKKQGYRNDNAMLALLTLGPLPAHLERAADWYIERFHPEGGQV